MNHNKSLFLLRDIYILFEELMTKTKVKHYYY